MKKMASFSLIMMVMLFLFTGGCNPKIEPIFGEMTDARDGQTYKTVTLGDQTWLAQNLNYETENNSWCYQDKSENCDNYGRLYTWEEALTACPDGWHLGSDEEWSTLIKYLDPKADPNNVLIESEIAGGMMKATGTIEDGTGLWRRPNTGATNVSGFSAVPGGERVPTPAGMFNLLSQHAFFWTSTEYDARSAGFRTLDYGHSGVTKGTSTTNMTKAYGLSVRCIMD
ncbi:MAG: fibrobacter succinogenes major paralogous domain-containing protein [Proteobacteria bacterium]|nr:fibrobacter succinogenes major paralogous domain-containing protein [Pseudomonadota bacterium]